MNAIIKKIGTMALSKIFSTCLQKKQRLQNGGQYY